jgi:hypothetical protein
MTIDLCESPIFVVGAPRSGTSMMQWAFRQHPALWGGPESDFLAPLHQRVLELHAFGSQRGKLHWLSGMGVTSAELLRYVGRGINELYTARAGGRRWVEQTPQYALHMEDMLALFPGARFVYMQRDGRQVVHSLRNFVHPVEHEEATRIWAHFTRAGLEFGRGEHSDRIYVARYEKVVADTEAELRKIYEFVGEAFHPDSVEFIRSKTPINSSFASESGGDKLAPRWHGWTEAERRYFASEAGALLVELGYEVDDDWVKADSGPKAAGPGA